MTPGDDEGAAIVLIDGCCALCAGSVRFIVRRSAPSDFRFAALQSPAGRDWCRRHRLDPDAAATVILIAGDSVATRSDAVVAIAERLGGIWGLLGFLLRRIPRGWRDAAYMLISRHRYEWFGSYDRCFLPSPAVRQRFLDRGVPDAALPSPDGRDAGKSP